MKVSEYLNIIKNKETYINNSLQLKSYDNYGCIYKWLEKINDSYSIRREIFIELNENEILLNLENKTVVSYIEVLPAN
jgi:hypothetical protein